MHKEHQEVAKFYDTVYYKNTHSIDRVSRHHLGLARRINIQPQDRILDIACGNGGWLKCAKNQGAIISGIDISERAIETCRIGLTEGDFHVGVAEDLPFPDKHFDFVTCLGSLEHFLDQPLALREMVRVLKPKGKLLILVPNSGFLTYRLRLYKGTQQQKIRETIRSLEEWNAMFNNESILVTERWKDLHILDFSWIIRPPLFLAFFRLLQGLALLAWPIHWQYQVYHLCEIETAHTPKDVHQ